MLLDFFKWFLKQLPWHPWDEEDDGELSEGVAALQHVHHLLLAVDDAAGPGFREPWLAIIFRVPIL